MVILKINSYNNHDAIKYNLLVGDIAEFSKARLILTPIDNSGKVLR